MKLPLLTGYVFHPQTRTIDFSGTPDFDLRGVASIMNLTWRQEIYALSEPGLGGDAGAGAILTLDYDTRAMDSGDALLVIYEDGLAHLPVGAATDAKLEAVRALLAGSTETSDLPGTLPAGGVATPVAADPTRQFLELTNNGPETLSYRWGAPASETVGHVLSPGQSTRYESKVPTGELNLFSANGTNFTVTVG